jgi:hypothetical protein
MAVYIPSFQVLWGRPRFFFPSGFQWIIIFGSRAGSILSTWLYQISCVPGYVIQYHNLGIRLLAKEHFCECCSAGPTPHPPTWRTRISLFLWPLTLILSGKGDPTSSYATAGIALGILEIRKPNHPVQCTFVKVEIPSIGEHLYLIIYKRFADVTIIVTSYYKGLRSHTCLQF